MTILQLPIVRHKQSKDYGPGIETHQARKPGGWGIAQGQNWQNKDLAPRVTYPPLAYCWPWALDPLTFHMASLVG